MTTDRRLISLVSPAYNEQTNVHSVITRLNAVIGALPNFRFETLGRYLSF